MAHDKFVDDTHRSFTKAQNLEMAVRLLRNAGASKGQIALFRATVRRANTTEAAYQMLADAYGVFPEPDTPECVE